MDCYIIIEEYAGLMDGYYDAYEITDKMRDLLKMQHPDGHWDIIKVDVNTDLTGYECLGQFTMKQIDEKIHASYSYGFHGSVLV